MKGIEPGVRFTHCGNSFTSAPANKGVTSELWMTYRHKTESAYRGYTHHELEQLRAAVEKIPALR
ncbi:MAG TPA: hypothetical protein VKV04_19255 [Verrucomicrobiae bacterium]|nr:hypothetical protein [Verrucomicrobiae bacterium]